MDNFDFNKIVYRRPVFRPNKNVITEVVGFDTESYETGKPFLFCSSKGDWFYLEDIPDKLFSRKYEGTHFVCYNLKYDSGSLIWQLPDTNKKELWELTKTKYNGYTYFYIPHKLLRITRGKNSIKFWDISQFFVGGLDKNAKKYLHKSKLELSTKKFSYDYVTRNLDLIGRYCINDAKLTKELADYLLKHIHKFKIYPNSIYSTASISFNWFKNNGKIIDVWRFWKFYRELLEYACHSYYGGKFELTARGSFYGYEYDIISAYANEVSNLVDISNAHIVKSNRYIKEATYGFLEVAIDNQNIDYHPITIKQRTLNTYPLGNYSTYITKQEYDYLVNRKVKVEILSGYWLIIYNKSYPYQKRITKLYRIKEYTKKTNPFISKLAKLMMNSFYGKMCQLIPDEKGNLKAGSGWCPIYASIVTANVRIKISEIQEKLGKNCLAVHTDSVITDVKLPGEYIGKKVGQLELKEEGKCILVLCGMYQIGTKVAYRGIDTSEKINWETILRKIGNRSTYDLPTKTVKSWIEALRTNTPDEINKFIDNYKYINLNIDSKRIWESKTTGNKLLAGIEYSLPKVKVDMFSIVGSKRNGNKENRLLRV
jgi:hypothetical protein